MSHKNYTKYSKFSAEDAVNVIAEPAVRVDPVIDENESAIIEQPLEGQTTIPEVEPEIIPEEPAVVPRFSKLGKVCGGKKLNVRKLPNPGAEILSALPDGTEVMIDETVSTATFYKIYTAHGLEGYCMKDYIKVLP